MWTWENDKLDRKASAEFLTDYLEKRYQSNISNGVLDSFVLAINAEWGFGKSYLLHNWQDDLKSKKFVVVHFDAWKNDFSEEPLIGFISEIEASLKAQLRKSTKAQTLIDTAFSGAKRFMRPALKTIAEVAAKKLLSAGIDEISQEFTEAREDHDSAIDQNAIDDVVVKFLDRFADEAVKEHRKRKEAIESFREGMEKLVKQISSMETKRLPIFILIDELDRCRPSYSIELLESIKHLFGVNGVYFVIATNISQLEHSVCVLYGHDFDSGRYLKRFFDQEYQLPSPNHYSFAEYLLNRANILNNQKLFSVIQASTYPDKNIHVQQFALLSSYFRLSLRDQEQIVSSLEAIVITWKFEFIHLTYLLLLVMLRHQNNQLFDRFKSGMDRGEFKKALEEIVDLTVVFNYIPHSNSRYSQELKTMEVFSVLQGYDMLAKTDLKEISSQEYNIYDFPLGMVKSKLHQELPGSFYPSRKYPPSLLNYSDIVSQAGHLSS